MQKNLNFGILEVVKQLFKRRVFDFITIINEKWHYKQHEALEILTDNETEEFVYGGAAGGAKSWTGAVWLLFMCLLYPNTRWFIGREELKRIKKSTLVTFFKVAKEYGATNYFKYNAQDNVIIFENGSVIELLELKYLPRDPMYERFGSIEYTGGWIEEGGEINFGAFDVLRTRIGRHLNKEFDITAKIFITCNPKKNWLYDEFYKPLAKLGRKEIIKKFLQAFVDENPFIDPSYIERLKRTDDKAKKERLLNGNWDYDDDPYVLCGFENITAIFENDHVKGEEQKYITADIARLGSDYARIGVWEGWKLIEIVSFELSKTTEIQAAIEALRFKHGIAKHYCIADEDGVGGGVVDNCGIVGFVNNSRPFKEVISEGKEEVPNYDNLQTQCIFGLAEKINKNEFYFAAEIAKSEKEAIEKELGSMKRDPKDLRKIKVTNKDQVKKDIGHSPDWRDMFLMRKYFDYNEALRNDFKFIK
jgi:hypothetical protein